MTKVSTPTINKGGVILFTFISATLTSFVWEMASPVLGIANFSDIVALGTVLLLLAVYWLIFCRLFRLKRLKRIILVLWSAILFFLFILSFSVLPLLSGSPIEINRVSLENGKTYLLADDYAFTDVAYSLWTRNAVFPIFWRRVSTANLSHSENGKYTTNPALLLSADQNLLLVRRGGIWTDCLVTAKPVMPCEETQEPVYWKDDEGWLQRSELISDISGVTPENSTSQILN